MKIRGKLTITFLIASFLNGCSTMSDSNAPWKDNVDKITKAIKDTSIKNIGDYSAIGYVATSANQQTKKTRKK